MVLERERKMRTLVDKRIETWVAGFFIAAALAGSGW
jgi:hypothetical protein